MSSRPQASLCNEILLGNNQDTKYVNFDSHVPDANFTASFMVFACAFEEAAVLSDEAGVDPLNCADS